ncbi:uncharacterized protein Z520_04683 [Fonsecaea multimorphosa CBS 102226]|uniref:Protein translocase SEC61 complex gamma subunit, archaeal and eukaryotic n=1 Tax=Fonsecaea multimorphosa CBS 102226 TaxID=1442371 RepID=A0A0D2KA54_9EURO|nr:uncharacterized protein Z520_04683 [Fonsecaea multimorphosa CBS 102226]KIY00045.1 hypothetical protein Z520_04683 [Fonsecaea multimorphosa CBS 102226]
MSEILQEIADVPKEFFKDGTQFINRCTKPDRREFIKISQAVGMGFLIMGAIGYFIKLSASLPPPFPISPSPFQPSRRESKKRKGDKCKSKMR